MDIVYAPSYQSLIFALENFNTNQIEIITRNESICKFCIDIEIKCKILKLNNDLSINGLYSYKKYLVKESKKIQNKNIYFFFYAFGTYDMFFVEKLKKKNNIYFKNLDPIHKSVRYVDLIKNYGTNKYIILNWILFIIIFKMKLNFYSSNKKNFLGYDLKKLKKYNYKQPSKIKSNEIKFKKIIKVNYDCIYICSGREKDNLPIMNEIPKQLNERGISFAIKDHPNPSIKYVFQKNIPRINSHIPAELLIYSDCKLIIGDYSVSLNKISEQIKTISLIKLFKSNNKNWDKEILDNHLTNNKISFPENLNELKVSLKNLNL